MDALGQHLPERYAPLRSNGAGLQSVYLTRLSEELAGALLDLMGAEAQAAYSTRSRTPFRADGGQHSAVMADTVPR
jgi:hypothetical protein